MPRIKHCVLMKFRAGTAQAQIDELYADLRAIASKLPGILDFSGVTPGEQIVLKQATHQRPEKRYATTLDMVKALRDATANMPKPKPAAPQLSKPSSRITKAGFTSRRSWTTTPAKISVCSGSPAIASFLRRKRSSRCGPAGLTKSLHDDSAEDSYCRNRKYFPGRRRFRLRGGWAIGATPAAGRGAGD